MTKTKGRGGPGRGQGRKPMPKESRRVRVSPMVKPETKATIKAAAETLGISQGEVIDQWAAAHHAAASGSPGDGGKPTNYS